MSDVVVIAQFAGQIPAAFELKSEQIADPQLLHLASVGAALL